MTHQQLYSKVAMLSAEPLKQELALFLDYLLSKQITAKKKTAKKIPQFGCARGKFRIADDFDAPLDDHFKDYMPS